MASKFELSISTEYVPDWTYVQAIREIFQNALDNETVNTENKMGFTYDKENQRLSISNKTSVLNPESLLLGNSTKRDAQDTIGKHGEGYKIAFMVLLREGKDVTVYNYGAREIWETKLVKAKRYNNNLVPTILINKQSSWHKVPNDDLTIVIDNIIEEEYENLKKNNLNIQEDVEIIAETSIGRILGSEEEKGNVYVKGLFVCKSAELDYGYDFNPKFISLDRDRKLVDSFNLKWQASRIWGEASSNGPEIAKNTAELVVKGAKDVEYLRSQFTKTHRSMVSNNVAELFMAEHGENAYPVSDTEMLNKVTKCDSGLKPVIVSVDLEKTLLESDVITEIQELKEIPVRDRLQNFMGKIESKLSDEELEELQEIIDLL